ncbi:hypothetical protein POM88_016198 [Heracleum sosnowskyi]|uniref:PUB2-4-like N-terminal domain-containing protein n=1 Tax=Heracleum sosnowskyi TaxID=360622 RepID=A0AAD8MSQ0_9APIA|nr:hypothetical protein POM88_016198 [Heracleum sosnowskyi]
MEISKLKALLKNISGLFNLSSRENLSFEPVQKYYHKVEEMMKVIRLVLDAIVDAEVASDELLQELFASLDDSVDELREIFETWHPLMSKVYFRLLHDWNDEESVKILKKCHEALPDYSKVVIMEMMPTELPENDFMGKNRSQLDIHMMIILTFLYFLNGVI